MRAKNFFIVTRLIMATTFLLIGSCAMLPMKGYDGPDLSADRTAIIENGVYIDINKCNGVKLGSFQDKVIILPGDHTIEMSFQTQIIWDYIFYSRETASLTFKTEAGHSYVVYALFSIKGWKVYVKDKKTNELIAQSETLPIIQEWIGYDVS